MVDEVELEHRMTAVEKLAASNRYRIDDLERNQEALTNLTTSVAVMASEQKTITKTVEKIDGKMDALENKPAKRWEGIVDKSIWAVCAAVIAFVLARVGL